MRLRLRAFAASAALLALASTAVMAGGKKPHPKPPPSGCIPPVVGISVNRSSLWPPNHNLIDVGLSVWAKDDTDPNPSTQVWVYSNEPEEDQTGDGHHSPDAKFNDGCYLRLRSERKGNSDGRIYLVVAVGWNKHCKTTATRAASVVVPHSKSRKSIEGVNARARQAVAFINSTGTIPNGFHLIGNGPIIGPKQ